MGNALVNQAGFFTARDDINRKPQHFVGTQQKFISVARFAQRLRGHSAYFGRFETSQSFTKPCQTVPARLHGLRCQVAVFIQPAALAHGFFQVLGTAEFAVVYLTDFQAKTVGPQINGGQAISSIH